MRDQLQSGRGRLGISLAAFAVMAVAMGLAWGSLRAGGIQPLEAMQKVAFVVATFSVTAYNLRTRVVDLVVRWDAPPRQLSRLAGIARDCGERLTALVLYFTICATAMGAGGFLPQDNPIAKWVASALAGLFAWSFVQFVYIVFAFERLERAALQEAEEASRRKEAERLSGGRGG
ncbi:MAG: hypothetical protein KF791_08450 [Verrucomicrobiae bacterium]|nr:hypothetical protein [Verrucomicrobiae bacterium]